MFKKLSLVLFMFLLTGVHSAAFADGAPSPAPVPSPPRYLLPFTPAGPAGSPDFSKWRRTDQEHPFAIPSPGTVKNSELVTFLLKEGVCFATDLVCRFRVHYYFSGDAVPPTKIMGRYVIQRVVDGVVVGPRLESFCWGDYQKPDKYHFFRFIKGVWVVVALGSPEYKEDNSFFVGLWDFEVERQNPTQKR